MEQKVVKIDINNQDKALLDSLIKLLSRAKVELQGAEVIVAADAMRWLSRLQKKIEEEQNAKPIQIVDNEPIKKEVIKKSK